MPTATTPGLQEAVCFGVRNRKPEHRLAHPTLRQLISGYYVLSDPSILQGRHSFSALYNGLLYLHIFQDDLETEVSSGQRTTKAFFPGFIAGQTTTPKKVTVSAPVRTVSIEIFPAALELIFNVSVLDIAGSIVSINDICDKSFRNVLDQVREQQSIDEHKSTLDTFFLSKNMYSENIPFYHRYINPIFSSSGKIRIRDIQQQSALSKRQFERKFKDHSGMSPSVMRRFIRSSCALSKSLKGDNVNDVAYELGFFDQSHLIKDIKWYTGKTPKHLYENCRNRLFRLGSTTCILE